MPAFPGMLGDVFFGDPEEHTLPDWRAERDAHEEDDDIDRPLTGEELDELVGKLGFDPNDVDDDDGQLTKSFDTSQDDSPNPDVPSIDLDGFEY